MRTGILKVYIKDLPNGDRVTVIDGKTQVTKKDVIEFVKKAIQS